MEPTIRMRNQHGLRRKRQRGSYLVLAAFVLVVLMLASGLAVDVSRKFSLEQNCQDIADAAAMAGANMLPDAARARLACSTYIQTFMSAANGQYVLETNAIQIRVDTATRSCTIGVIISGTWDPVLMPTWLLGDERYQTSRYSIAVMAWDTIGGGTIGATIDDRGLDTMAFFIGDTYSVANNPQCGGGYEADISGQNFSVHGASQINHDLNVNGANAEFDGQVNVVGTSTAPGATFSPAVTTSAPIVAMPKLDESKMNVDINLDINDPDVAAYFPLNVAKSLVAGGTDGRIGVGGDDITIKASNSACNNQTDVTVTYTGTVAGHQQWSISTGNNLRINSACFASGLGNGLDLKVNGDVVMTSGDGMDGFIWTTGSLELQGTMNADFNMTQDNPGLCVYTGPPADPTLPSFLCSANLSQQSFIGLLYIDGNCKFNGNGSNNEDTILGGLWAKRIDDDCSAGLFGNNWGITGDPSKIGDIPLVPLSSEPVRNAAPNVWLAR